MRGRVRVPMFVVAAALLGLIAMLAALQYRWLGRISQAERERRGAALSSQASAFALDFDRELTRAYLTFQLDPGQPEAALATRIAARHARWQSTAPHPRLVREVLVARAGETGAPALQRFNAVSGGLDPMEWPDAMRALRARLDVKPVVTRGMSTFVHPTVPSVWEDIPALVVGMPIVLLAEGGAGRTLAPAHAPVYAVVVLDRDYITGDMLPALARQHFQTAPDGADYRLAVVRVDDSRVLYRSVEQFSPAAGARVDATTDLFGIRLQEFGAMASEIRRFSFTRTLPPGGEGDTRNAMVEIQRQDGADAGGIRADGMPRMSIVLQQDSRGSDPSGLDRPTAIAGATAAALAGRRAAAPATWRLVVQHRAGSLEAAVDATRRRNLAISSGVLAMLGVSVGFLVLSTRRAQRLANQQMEFVAAVSHELRTPLAVIRSAGENLADGVVHDDAQIRKYGDLVRSEGRRLTDMVEQILEFSGIHSGQRSLVFRPVAVRPVLEEAVGAAATLIKDAGLAVEYDIPAALPPVLADEPALRRVVQNLVGNAIKYGEAGGWIGLRAAARGREVEITVADRGIGIAPAEQPRIFEPFYRAPDVVAAQIHGAGLGLSLVKRIVESHGGRVAVRSAPGSGSEFSVFLPAATGEPVARVAPAVEHPHRA